jgi:hypothetical protein
VFFAYETANAGINLPAVWLSMQQRLHTRSYGCSLKEVNGMNPVIKFVSGREGFPGWKVRRLLVLAGTATLAFRYCLAAQWDEKNRFPFTAAMEWQKAAYLFAPFDPFADLCWRQWERIVRLPRQMAEPISDQPQHNARTSRYSVPVPAGNELPLLLSTKLISASPSQSVAKRASLNTRSRRFVQHSSALYLPACVDRRERYPEMYPFLFPTSMVRFEMKLHLRSCFVWISRPGTANAGINLRVCGYSCNGGAQIRSRVATVHKEIQS